MFRVNVSIGFCSVLYCCSLLLQGCEELFEPTDLLNFYSLNFYGSVIDHLRAPNESNLLNYFTFSFLVRRPRDGKQVPELLQKYTRLLYFFNFGFLDEN